MCLCQLFILSTSPFAFICPSTDSLVMIAPYLFRHLRSILLHMGCSCHVPCHPVPPLPLISLQTCLRRGQPHHPFPLRALRAIDIHHHDHPGDLHREPLRCIGVSRPAARDVAEAAAYIQILPHRGLRRYKGPCGSGWAYPCTGHDDVTLELPLAPYLVPCVACGIHGRRSER